METIQTDRLFWYRINVVTKRGGDRVESLYWELLPWEVRIKWDWYFKYRAALLQVKYPRFIVDQFSGNTEKVDADEIRKKNDIIRLKGNITKCNNRIVSIICDKQVMIGKWNQLFPIEDDPEYQRMELQLAVLECKLKELRNELESKLKLVNQAQL